ncbi:Apolipoprotein L3 [Acipenser ruthenus]|uniref:Apolipoprotein L3 n=1 Tax=Acipenser ruthenus TaxID=7906 RepID=A0A444UR71_ACIRT|nr:Apolipoprotein L3 [Acipenser ruthenus]
MEKTTTRRKNSIEDLSEDHDRLKEFVQLSEKKPLIVGHLRELRQIADKLDKVNMNCAIAKTTGSYFSAVGGIMRITGLVLAPFTFGASAVLAAAGAVATAAGRLTNVTTEIVQNGSDRNDIKRVQNILNEMEPIWGKFCNSYNNTDQAVSKTKAKHIRDVFKTFVLLVLHVAVGGVLVKAAKSLSEGARVFGGVAAGALIVWDIKDITENSIDIHKGCKTEIAKEIRKLGKMVESDLGEMEVVCSDI